MSVTGVGSSYSYWYDPQTKKLSTKDGSKDAFVDYFNGELPEEEYGELNGYNAKMKNDIEAMIRLFGSGVSGANIFQSDDGLYDISAEIVNGAEAKYSVNGQHSFTGYAAMPYTRSQISQFADYFQPYKTYEHKGYNPVDNSINIAVGDVYDLGGYRITVGADCMKGDGWRQDEESIRKFNLLLGGLNALMRLADGITISGMMDEEMTPMVLDFLQKQGIDTSRPFIINGTELEVVNGRIKEVGNTHVVPNSIYQEALKRYEQWLYQPLANRDLYMDDWERNYD